MSALVPDLLTAASDDNQSIGAVLRKALIVASKLGIDGEEIVWIRRELDGYGDHEPPPYRTVKGQFKVRTP